MFGDVEGTFWEKDVVNLGLEKTNMNKIFLQSGRYYKVIKEEDIFRFNPG